MLEDIVQLCLAKPEPVWCLLDERDRCGRVSRDYIGCTGNERCRGVGSCFRCSDGIDEVLCEIRCRTSGSWCSSGITGGEGQGSVLDDACFRGRFRQFRNDGLPAASISRGTGGPSPTEAKVCAGTFFSVTAGGSAVGAGDAYSTRLEVSSNSPMRGFSVGRGDGDVSLSRINTAASARIPAPTTVDISFNFMNLRRGENLYFR